MHRSNYPMDDQGAEIRFFDLSNEAMDALIRFSIDGTNEGIHAGILPGELDEDSLAHWGMI